MEDQNLSETIKQSATLAMETREIAAQSRNGFKDLYSVILRSKELIEQSRLLLEAAKKQSP